MTDFAQAKVVRTERPRGMLRRRENSQLANRREDVEQRNTSLPTPGGSETLPEDSERVERALLTPRGDKVAEKSMWSTSAGEEEGEDEQEQTVVPSSDISTPPEGGDFNGAEGSSEQKYSEFLRREGSSPPDNLETHAKGNGALSTEKEWEVATSREAEKIEEEEMKEDETTEGEESVTCTSFGLEPTSRTGQNEMEPTLITKAAVDQKNVEEEVLRILAETDWEIEPVEEREEGKAKELPVTVPVETGADGQVAEMSAENRPFLEIILGDESYRALLDLEAMVSLPGPRVIDRYATRLKPSTAAVKSVTGKVNRIVGELKVSLEVGGYLSTLSFKAIREIDHDLILGMDFFESFDVELRSGRRLWLFL